MPDKVLGYDVRSPFPGEDAFFSANRHVGGMAGEDGKITLNPYSTLSPAEKAAVAKNEAIRLHQREMGMRYTFPVTEQQRKSFSGSAYETNEPAMRETIVARALTGDPSAGELTEDQRHAAGLTQAYIDMLLRRLN